VYIIIIIPETTFILYRISHVEKVVSLGICCCRLHVCNICCQI